MSDKSNAIPTHRIWQERFKAVAKDYSGITAEHRYVDALALELVREPERFQVIVTNNLYGDILSDLGAGLVGDWVSPPAPTSTPASGTRCLSLYMAPRRDW